MCHNGLLCPYKFKRILKKPLGNYSKFHLEDISPLSINIFRIIRESVYRAWAENCNLFRELRIFCRLAWNLLGGTGFNRRNTWSSIKGKVPFERYQGEILFWLPLKEEFHPHYLYRSASNSPRFCRYVEIKHFWWQLNPFERVKESNSAAPIIHVNFSKRSLPRQLGR